MDKGDGRVRMMWYFPIYFIIYFSQFRPESSETEYCKMFWCIILLTTLISGATGNASLNVTGIRLAGGSGPYEGRVEVRVNRIWGTICDDNFDINDAKVLCRMMNLSATTYAGNARYGQGSGPIFATNLRCYGHESHIHQCFYDMSTNCIHAEDVSIICSECGSINVVNSESTSISSDGTTLSATCKSGFFLNGSTSHCNSSKIWSPPSLICKPEIPITGIRLANGLGLYDGRVEIMINGTWGDVCSYSFERNDADAICSMMFNLPVYTYYTSISSSYYGYNTHVHVDELECLGNERDIQECNFDFRTSCSTSRRATVICNAYPLNITDIRLTNGTGSNNGRVELKYNDEWGTVCSRYLSYAPHALCRMLNSSLTWSYTNAKFGSGTGPMLIGRLSCSSSSDHINSCSTYPPNRYSYSCSKNYIAALICTDCGQPSIPNGEITTSNGSIMTVTCNTGYVPTTYTIECLSNGTWLQNETCEVFGYPLNITDMRLADGVGLYDGRLEVQVNGTWGTVCYNSFSNIETITICNILFGGTNYRYYGSSYYGSGTGPIYIENLDCKGTESHINECKYNVLNTCSHSRDTVVACDAAPYNITDIRLMNGTGPHNGRVELLVDGVWGTVCNYRVNLNVANTLCNMMNMSLWSYYTSTVYGMGSGPIHVGSLSCGGSYSHINQCTYYSPYRGHYEYCTHNKDLSLACTDNRLNITEIRLAPGPYHGRVEIKVNNTWGTVCDNGFDTYDGRVICRMMNSLNMRSVYGNAYYGEGTGPVHIDRMSCSGNEEDINKCSYIYDNSCGHIKDSSVLCYGPDLNITGARLADGTGSNDGRVEIEINGTWGTICDRNFDINDAEAFCQMLDLRAAQYFTGARYGEGTGPVYIDELYCNSGTSDLNKCPYLFTNACGHERDASVVCNECGQPDIYYWDIGYFSYKGTTLYADCAYYRSYIGTLSMTCDNNTTNWITEGECKEYRFPLDIRGIRLVNGNASSDGRVEIKSMDTWGTICDDGFSMNEANTICRMLGFWPAITYYSNSKYGAGTGPIFVDDLQCGTDASHINNCSYVTYDDCTHDKDISVVCLDCGDPTPLNGMINSTNTYYGTVVEVSCETQYRLVGNNTISCEMSGSWSDRPYCHYIDCESPQPAHGTVNSSSTTNGTIVSVTCNPGYNLSGDAIIMCQSNDEWTDYPTCEILDCGLPTPENADVDLPSNATTYGAIAVISCKQGYLLDGSSTVSCLETGKWEDMPICEIIDCGDPTPIKGSRNDTNTTYGTVVEITCDEGLDITGNSTIVCQVDGTWSDNPVCDDNDCGRPSVSNGQVDVSNGTTSGSIAIITCNQGYDLNGSAAVVCLAAGWNDTSMECILQDCGDPTPENGNIVTSTGTKYGDTATIECHEGHKMEGDSTISCEDGSLWSSETVCKIRDCGPLESSENGHIVSSSGTVFNSTITFSCNASFLLVGESTLLCRNDGQWSGDVPLCVQLGGIGEPCETSDYCKAEGAICKMSLCTCRTGVYDNRTDKCDTMPLYPYGESEGDLVVQNWNECARRVKFSLGLPLFGKTHIRLFVCPHGVVSFGRRYNNPTPPKNNNKVNGLPRDMLAPFHAHFNASTGISSGKVYYRSYDVLDSYEPLKDRAEIRDIEDRVRQFGSISSFEASFVLIATWENVLPEDIDLKTANSEASTFQLVLVSNGEMTYSYYIYPDGLMKWIHKLPNYAPVWVGYFGKKHTAFTHPYSFTPNVLALDKNAKHGGVSGVVFKSLVHVENSTNNNNVSCVTWYQENKHEKQHIDLMNSWLPQCPCDISLARWDPWFWQIDRWNWYNKKNYTCVDMLPGRIYRPYGKSCCYDYRTSLWVDERPIAGGFFRYHPENTADHYKHDVVSKEMCCSPLTPFCKFYYDLRPTGTCYRESPYNFGSFWGDPHFRTLDGLNFTFNGLGEYTLLQIQTENNTFDLQARTERAIKADGNISDATVFSAFAAKDETNASVHVELNKAKTGFNIYGNGLDLTKQYTQKTDGDTPMLEVPGGTLLVSKRGDTLVVLFPSSGISLNISVSVEMLSLSTIVPKKFHNVTSGLLGNYNGKPEDDFTLPNGTILRANITEREIFSYGQNWVIDADNSAFTYPGGKNHSDYHDETYVPRFLDEVDPSKRLEAEKACNGSENIECVFDYVFTEKEEIALATNLLKGNADKTRKEMDEVIPSLIGCESVNITVNHTVTCPVIIDDGTSVDFLANNVNATFNKITKSISYFQANDEPVDIRVIAKNSNGRSSPAFIVVILLCTGCNGHGYCTNIPREDVKNTEHFKYATCECQPEYEGPDCENVFDGCSEDPCSLGRNCTSLDAFEQRDKNRTYMCDACPSGFVSNDEYNDICSDFDECVNKPCSHNCTNTDGSYECTCNQGYRTDTREKDRCTDINECEDLNTPHDCEQNCTNTEGSYNCSCFEGYSLNMSENCTPNLTLEHPCSNTNCSQSRGGCSMNDEGIPVCFCNSGYRLASNDSCIDINECSRNACPQKCNNTIGGFVCSCFTGYKLKGLTTCLECDSGFWGENCQNECKCTGEGVKSCDSVKGCICEDGWQGDTCDENINECNTTIDICKDPRKKCADLQGSYHCKCMEGFKETGDGKCEDIDECSLPSLNTCDQICKNNIGSYSCDCKSGFKAGTSSCENIDECALKVHDCEQVCDDKTGSYNCFCYYGYTLNDDRRTCTKLSDPCMTLHGLNCSHYCFISTGHSECRCRDGFILGSDNQICIDIDECKNGSHSCDAKAECKNTDGSYTCECPIGSKLENDGRTCTECDSFHYGENCASNCSCLHGDCDRTSGCKCENGWRGNNCDIDLDECTTEQVMCSKPNEVCVNTLGSAVCHCINGYYRNDFDVCVDVNECSDGSLNTCDQSCVNLPGGYTCECQSGFLFIYGKCQDINECENQKSDCEQLCENTLGSYRCYCEDGFKLNQTDRVSCRPASECSSDACGVHAICFNNNGVESCLCMNGFHNDSGKCEDVDECKISPKPCSHNCTNTNGSYYCTCNCGYYLAKDYRTCRECESGTFGVDCKQNCSCDVHNTESCDHITGLCRCKPGWNGTNCDEDINECNNQTICPNHSTCNNTDGGYDCNCEVGYFKTSSGICAVCDDTHHGKNCAEECTCMKASTVSCNNTNGYCECNEGWTGKNCSEDENECAKVPDICEDNSTCNNTQGSYKCMCDEGFREIGDTCVDIDECNTGVHTCTEECVNTQGSYACKCKKGYQGYWNSCKECSNHTYGENCSDTCRCRHANTIDVESGKQTCDRVTGKCECLVNWEGEFCEEDVDECKDVNICNANPNSGCVNTVGWFECQCYRGYKEVNNECVLDQDFTTTHRPDTALSINFILTIDYALSDTVNFNISKTYDHYEDLVKKSLMAYYQELTVATITIVITSLSKGSLVIDYIVMYEHNEVALDLVNAANALDDGSKFTFNGSRYSAKITSDSIDLNDDACTIVHDLGACNREDCVIENGAAQCKIDTDAFDLPQIIGISVGCGISVLIIAILVIVCMRRRNNYKKQTKKYSTEGRSLPDVPSQKHDLEYVKKWQDNQCGSDEPRYQTWRTILTEPASEKLDENVYDEPFKIPRARARQPTKPSTNTDMYF